MHADINLNPDLTKILYVCPNDLQRATLAEKEVTSLKEQLANHGGTGGGGGSSSTGAAPVAASAAMAPPPPEREDPLISPQSQQHKNDYEMVAAKDKEVSCSFLHTTLTTLQFVPTYINLVMSSAHPATFFLHVNLYPTCLQQYVAISFYAIIIITSLLLSCEFIFHSPSSKNYIMSLALVIAFVNFTFANFLICNLYGKRAHRSFFLSRCFKMRWYFPNKNMWIRRRRVPFFCRYCSITQFAKFLIFLRSLA